MNENTNRLPGSLHMDSINGQGLFMVGSATVSQIERRACRSTAQADRGDAITLDATHIKDLISIFGAKSRVDGTSSETRQAYADCMQAIDAMFAKTDAGVV